MQSSSSFSHRVLKDDLLPAEPAVDSREGLQLVFRVVALLRVQVDLEEHNKRIST